MRKMHYKKIEDRSIANHIFGICMSFSVAHLIELVFPTLFVQVFLCLGFIMAIFCWITNHPGDNDEPYESGTLMGFAKNVIFWTLILADQIWDFCDKAFEK